jgi:NADH-quinone oxidoreductase subunit E
MSFAVPATLESEINEVITHYPEKRSASLMLLHAVQEHFGFVSDDAIEWIAKKLGLRPINILELVTFYPMFRREKLGQTHVKVCRTLSCALAGSGELRDHFCKKLGLDPHKHVPQTTPDEKFTVEFVECLADCGNAPVVLLNEDILPKVTTAKADEILAKGH